MKRRQATHAPSAIERRLYEFIDVLRDASIRISAEEVISLFSALRHVSILDKEVFRQALKTTLVKDYTDIPVFDRCFEEFFCGSGDSQSDVIEAFREIGAREGLREALQEKTEDFNAIESAIESFVSSLPDDVLLERSPEEILGLFLEEFEGAASGGGSGMMFSTIRGRGRFSRGEAVGTEEDRDLTGIIAGMAKRRLSHRRIGTRIRNREEYLLQKPIYRVTQDEIREMRDLIRRFGQKLKNRVSLRKKRVKHGRIDIKRTLRKSLQFGGVPFTLVRKDRKIDRPQLVVLCDISGSVNQYSRFMLLLTYTLQSLFSKVRTFAFISSIVEITPLFMEMDPERALNSIFEDTNFTYGWGSNYGRCFEQFVADYSDSLTRKTTVLILGDGRNNYQDPGIEALIRIKERSRHLLWLNPDRRHLWNWADSIACLYRQYCDDMKEVSNFLDLSDFIDDLFL